MKGLSATVNVMFGNAEMPLQLTTDSPFGLGKLSHSCQLSSEKIQHDIYVVI